MYLKGATLTIILSLMVSSYAASLSFQRTYGGIENDIGYAIRTTNDDNFIIAGGTKSYGVGGGDAYLMKINRSGNVLWSQTYGGSGMDQFADAQQTADGGYITAGMSKSYGSSRGKMYLVKTDNEGNQDWYKTYGHGDWTHAHGVQQTSDGGYILVGNSTQTDPWLDIRLTKVDSNGNEQWTKFFGRSYDDTGFDVKQTSDGGYIIVGRTGVWSSNSQIWVIKTDSNGNTVWDSTLGGPGNQIDGWDDGYYVEELADGSFVIGGTAHFSGHTDLDAALIKLDSNGDELWAKSYGGSGHDRCNEFVQLSDGGFALVGGTQSFGAGGNDAYLIRTDTNGNSLWTKTFGGSEEDVGQSIQALSDTEFLITGYTNSFGAGGVDIWLIGEGLAPEPIPEPTTLCLMGFGLFGLLCIVIRQRKRK